MNRRNLLVLGFGLVMATAASAMPIPQFDKLTVPDRTRYVTLLVKGSVDALTARGNTQDADKLYGLFNGGSGATQFVKDLETLRTINSQNISDRNNEQPYEVEQAFALTLKQNGIIVPLNFLLSINKDFKPATNGEPAK